MVGVGLHMCYDVSMGFAMRPMMPTQDIAGFLALGALTEEQVSAEWPQFSVLTAR
jgi:hypothetical protein